MAFRFVHTADVHLDSPLRSLALRDPEIAEVIGNAQHLSAVLQDKGLDIVTGGTDNHMIVVDTASSFGRDGRDAEEALDRVAITTNKQVTPDDPRPPLRPSGIRIGTPAVTTRGMDEQDMERLAGWMTRALRARADEATFRQIRDEVEAHCRRFPVPGVESAPHASAA